jgi:hypothetical protein
MKKLSIILIVIILVVVGLIWWYLLENNNAATLNMLSNNTSSIVAGTQTSTPAPSNQTSTASSTRADVWGEYHVSLPDGIILVDSQGRRTGKDPITGTTYHEIPGTSYIEIGTPSTNGAGELFTTNLPDGQYTLYVIGVTTGSYWLDLEHYGQKSQSFNGTIQAGSMIAYVQNYNTANIASSTFSVLSTVSSTVSITSTPPNNLPSPSVP